MHSTRTNPLRWETRAFTLLESLLTLAITSFLVLTLTASVATIFDRAKETLFFIEFEQLYVESQQLAIQSHQQVVLEVEAGKIGNGYQQIELPSTVAPEKSYRIVFDAGTGGNSSLQKVVFQTAHQSVAYQLYIGSGRYKKSES